MKRALRMLCLTASIAMLWTAGAAAEEQQESCPQRCMRWYSGCMSGGGNPSPEYCNGFLDGCIYACNHPN